METIGYLLAVVSLVWLWTTKIIDSIMFKQMKTSFYVRPQFTWFNKKPFNCGTCLSGWIGIIFFACGFSIFFLSLPILYKLITRIIEL